MRALFFSPYSIISRHVKPEIDLMMYLISNDWSIDVIQCNGLMSDFCTSMASMGLEPNSSDLQKKLVCLGCNASRKALQKALEEFAPPVNAATEEGAHESHRTSTNGKSVKIR